MNPKIIAVIGAPRSGKTFLVQKLAEALGYTAILEGNQDDFPDFIKEDIKTNRNGQRRLTWFREKQREHLEQAQALKAKGVGSVLDTFWLDSHMYLDVLLNGKELEEAQALAEHDILHQPWPDSIIFLKNNPLSTHLFVQAGGRDFDNLEQIASLQEKYEGVLTSVPSSINVICIDRSNIDFANKKEVEGVMRELKSKEASR